MHIKRALVATFAGAVMTAGALAGGAGVAGAAHSHVDNPSGCHETNGNARNGSNDAWTNSADGHERAAERSEVHSAGGC